MPVYLSSPSSNPFARLVGAVLAVIVTVGAFMLGLVALAVVLGIALVLSLVVWVRVWWLRRRFREAAEEAGWSEAPGRGEPGRHGDTIEAEYTVVSRDRD